MRREAQRRWAAVGAAWVALACGGRASNCYPGEPCENVVASGLACPDGEATGNFDVGSQAELDELGGCERIDGDLSVRGFAGADLRPLSALREVTGELSIGGPASNFGQPDAPTIDSLAGLENLRHVGQLTLTLVDVDSLEALGSLETIGPEEVPRRSSGLGQLRLVRCASLRDFRGLGGPDGATRYQSLYLWENDSLESLAGLPAKDRVHRWVFRQNRRLERYAPVPGEVDDELVLSGTPLVDLSPFSSLRDVRTLVVAGNPALESLAGLSNLESFLELSISENPGLTSLPRFENVTEFRSFGVGNNPSLVTDASFPAVTDLRASRGGVYYYGNARLERISAFGNVESVRTLTVTQNESLRELALPSLAYVAVELEVTCNPALDEDSLATLQAIDALESRIERNGRADATCGPPDGPR